MEGVDFEMSSAVYPKLTLRSTVIVYVYAVAIAALASLIPSARAARIKPVEALRTT
jgi:ABC-type lipoprotein release transport system permease subunit